MNNYLPTVALLPLLLIGGFLFLQEKNHNQFITSTADHEVEKLNSIDQNHNFTLFNIMEPVELINENFDSGSLPDGWTEVVLNSTGSNTWTVGTSNSIGSANAAVVSNRLAVQDMDMYDSSDPDDNSNDIVLLTPLIDATNIIDLALSFTWGAGGESDTSNPPLLDYGSLVYSFNGTTFTDLGVTFAGDGAVILTPATDDFSMSLNVLNGEKFHLGFRWINDQLVAGTASFAIDDVLLTGNTDNSDPLAVELLDFKVDLIDYSYTQLTWETTNEIQNRRFDIMRALDGVHFEKIGFVLADEQRKPTNKYVFQDKNIGKGMHYYRLQPIGYAGKTDLSKIVSIDVIQAASAFQVYPTQIATYFTIEFNQVMTANAALKMFDISGKLVKTIPVASDVLQQEVNVANLPAGTYVLKLEQNEHVYSQTLIKR